MYETEHTLFFSVQFFDPLQCLKTAKPTHNTH